MGIIEKKTYKAITANQQEGIPNENIRHLVESVSYSECIRYRGLPSRNLHVTRILKTTF